MNKAKLLSTILLAGTSLFVSGQTNIPESPRGMYIPTHGLPPTARGA